MKVFLVPSGPARHVPYCEPADPAPAGGDHGRGYFARAVQGFREFVASVERSRLSADRGERDRDLAQRVKARMMGWLADRIAEQRLLWQLRHCEAATLVYPSDITASEAWTVLETELRRDGDRHRRWLMIDSLLLSVSAVLALLPGPNVIAYYFVFRVVGHYFAMRGARHGLSHTKWGTEMSTALHDLRTVLHLDPHTRRTRLRDIAVRLELPHLVTFVERVAFRGA
ncbi:MAG: hypothetical protein AB7I50_02260 [Vicinamibacterales bacterium]